MFNAMNGKAVIQARIEAASDLLAADAMAFLADPTVSEADKEAAIEAAAKIFRNRDTMAALAAGTYAQNSSGQPAAQLGSSGDSTEPNANENAALATLMASPLVDDGVKAALRRLLNPRDPAPLIVEANGTPVAVTSANNERDTAKAAKDAAEAALRDERDPAKAGSLAKQLADANATSSTPADLVRKDAVRPLAEAVKAAIEGIKPSMTGGGQAAKTAAITAAQEVIDKVS